MNPYKNIVLHSIPRILSNLDRDIDSPTCGSFDRNYWHYKIRDFSSAILQQSVLTLALVYKNNFKGNIYYRKQKIKQYIINGLNYWSKIQLRDGSFNEYWPNEHSIPATAFSLYAVCESCKIMNYSNPKIIKAIKKAVKFLYKNPETEALNQEIAATTAIINAYELTKDQWFKKASKIKFENILKKQSQEGWFSEYGGSDIGYLTVSLNYMIIYYNLTKDMRALNSAKKMLEFTSYFIHPDGTLGGEYSTRNTEYFLPSAFELMRPHSAIADSISNKLMQNINKKYLNLSIDERYILHYISPSYVMALLNFRQKLFKTKLPYKREFEKYFQDSKIYIKSTKKYYAVISLLKGGVIKAFSKKDNTCLTDTGYRIKLNNKILVSEWPDKSNLIQIKNNEVTVLTRFTARNFLKPTPIKHIGLRTLSLLFGKRIIQLTKNMLIFNNKSKQKETLLREFRLKTDSIEIIDKINKSKLIPRLRNGLSIRHTASSKFFQTSEMFNICEKNKGLIRGYQF